MVKSKWVGVTLMLSCTAHNMGGGSNGGLRDIVGHI